jgi:iron complex outermembrane recepter protein
MLLSGAACLACPLPAFAQDQALPAAPAETGADAPAPPPGAAPPAGQADDFHAPESQDIVVTGFARNRNDILSGTSVVSGEELNRVMRPSIGETLAHQPGVSATSFGPSASRPVLRGFEGDRIRILTDGLGSLDASSTSADHAVAINPLTADRIEVLRGPAALLYGSSAIGGVVNVIDSRIPRRIPNETVHADGILTYGSAADERSLNGEIDAPLGHGFVAHLDGNYTKTDDLEIGGFALTRALRDQAAASADPDIRALAELRGRLPNTASETSEIAGGLAWIDGDNNAGLSIARYDSLYGVPIRYSLDPAIAAEAPRLDLRQTRIDGRGEVDTHGWIDSLRLRAGYSDYRHFELEQNGDIATTFRTNGWEARAEAIQRRQGAWSGGFGVQYSNRDASVEGEEKFLPPNGQRQIGLFTVQNFDLGAFKAEAGARYEHASLHADADPDIGNPALDRDFDAVSASLGGSYEIAHGWRIGVNGSFGQRAPAPDELFANGPHAGTQAFEIGNPDFAKEENWGLEATLRGSGDGYSFGAALFHSWFRNYIYEQPTGQIVDDLPVFQFLQDDARYFGVEFEASARLATVGGVTINADGLADYVRATIDGVGPAPRIPPLRLLGGIEAQSTLVNGRIEAEWVSDQDRIAAFETRTDGFTLVNASLAFHPFGHANGSSVTLSANNLFDVTARRAASVLKDYAPLGGRDLRVSARFTF